MLGLIGAGFWGKNLIREFNNIEFLHTICDLDQDLLNTNNKLYPHINTTTDWNELLMNKDITAVCISLPAELHYKFCKDALLHDKDVFVEKPLSLKIEHCDELIELAKQKNKILMVGHILQYHACIKKLYSIIDDDYIGDIKYIVSNRLNLGKIRQEENVLWSFAPHDISVILRLLKNKLPNTVECTGQSYVSKNIHDITTTILQYDNCYVQINVNWLNPFKEQKLVIVGTKGMIIFDDMIEDKLKYYANYMQWYKGQPIPNKTEGEIIDYDDTYSPLYNECMEFMNVCETRQVPLTDGLEGKRVLSVLDMAQKSLMGVTNMSVHESSYVDDDAIIGEGTKIWHFCNVMKSRIGKGCNLGQNVFIGDNVIIGNNCKIQNNVSVYAGVEIGNNVFLGSSCVFTNDKNPRAAYSKNGKYIKTIIEDGVTIGANATIVCGIRLGKNCFIGAGAVVIKDVEENAVMVGNPARKIKEIKEDGELIDGELIGNNFVDSGLGEVII